MILPFGSDPQTHLSHPHSIWKSRNTVIFTYADIPMMSFLLVWCMRKHLVFSSYLSVVKEASKTVWSFLWVQVPVLRMRSFTILLLECNIYLGIIQRLQSMNVITLKTYEFAPIIISIRHLDKHMNPIWYDMSHMALTITSGLYQIGHMIWENKI